MHPLERKLAAVRRLARRTMLLRGALWAVSVVLPAVLLLALLDYWLRPEDRGLRLLWSFAALAVIVRAAQVFIWPAVRQRLSEVSLAERIERRLAPAGAATGQLSSAIEFLQQKVDDPLAGSAALRRAVVAATESRYGGADWSSVVNRRPAMRSVLVAAVVVAGVTTICVLRPAAARLAVARLASPLGSDVWPPKNELAFKAAVVRVAAGQPFEVELIDRKGNLPDDVDIEFRAADPSDAGATSGDQPVERQRMQRIGDVMVAHKDRVTRPFDYRAVGGDDHKMPWLHVDVVEPPAIKEMQVTLHPPKYTGWPASRGERRVVALRGTAVEFAATTNRTLSAAILHQPGGPDLPATPTPDRRGFFLGREALAPADSGDHKAVIPPSTIATGGSGSSPPAPRLIVDKSGQYWFELRDTDGMTAGADDRWEIQAIGDQPPTVTLDEPSGNLFVTPAASAPIKATVKDDLAIHTITLRYHRSDRTQDGQIEVPLWQNATLVPPVAAPTSGKPAQWATQTVAYPWDLAALKLSPGATVVFTVAASDYLPQTGESTPRRLTIITPEELEDRLAQRQSLIFSELERILKMQQSTEAQTVAVATQLDHGAKSGAATADQLRAVEVNQRQVRRSLTSAGEGLRSQITGLLDELTNNRVTNAAMRRRLQEMAGDLGRLDQHELADVERDLTSATKIAEEPATDGAKLRRAVSQVDGEQKAIAASLEQMLGDLGQWNSLRGVTHDLIELRAAQATQQREVKDLAAATVTKDVRELTAAQQAELARLATRQAELLGQFEKLTQHMDTVAERLKSSDPSSSDSVADAAHTARELAIGSQMRDGAAHVGQNQMGQALADQAAIGRSLDELLDTLSNRREQELSRLVKKLRHAQQTLDDLKAEQEGLRKKFKKAAANNEPAERQDQLQRLARQQQQLREQAERLARQLQRLTADKAAGALTRAGSHMDEQSQAAAQGGQQESSLDDVAKDLDDAQRQLAEARRKAEADLAHEQLGKIDDVLAGLIDRQSHANQETARLEKLRAAAGSLTRSQAQTVLELARAQQSLAEEVAALADKLSGGDAFQFMLHSAQAGMIHVADRLRERDTGNKTQQLEQDISARLGQLAAAMKPAGQPAPGIDNNNGGGNGGDGGSGQQQPSAMRSLAEARLVQLAQEDLNRRTERLAATIADKPPSADERDELAALAEEQGRLAELISKMIGDKKTDERP